jgi:hypothetical protein
MVVEDSGGVELEELQARTQVQTTDNNKRRSNGME